jgi:hypothetical protein
MVHSDGCSFFSNCVPSFMPQMTKKGKRPRRILEMRNWKGSGQYWQMRSALCTPTITLFNWTFVSFLIQDCIVLSNETGPHCLETFNTLVFLGDLVVVDLWRCSCLFHFTDSAIPNSKDVAMIRICAWCQQEGHQGNQEQMPESSLGLISHGICQYHSLGLQRTYRRSLLRQPVSTSSHRSSSTSSRIL